MRRGSLRVPLRYVGEGVYPAGTRVTVLHIDDLQQQQDLSDIERRRVRKLLERRERDHVAFVLNGRTRWTDRTDHIVLE